MLEAIVHPSANQYIKVALATVGGRACKLGKIHLDDTHEILRSTQNAIKGSLGALHRERLSGECFRGEYLEGWSFLRTVILSGATNLCD